MLRGNNKYKCVCVNALCVCMCVGENLCVCVYLVKIFYLHTYIHTHIHTYHCCREVTVVGNKIDLGDMSKNV